MRVKEQNEAWLEFIQERYGALINCTPISFGRIVPSMIPEVGGVYLITTRRSRYEVAYYIGRSKNLRRRIYTNHLMGPIANARLKRYLVGSGECRDVKDAKEFIRNNCSVRWIEENDSRRRGAIEGYCVGLLFPIYGIYQEH
ncbi:hypothetical protein ACFLW7_02145 [Chloroflexota bacterium]